MEDTIKVRIKFTKHGAIRYIGHLDVMRYFQKCFRRAEIDIAYTQGYSPHQIMSFAQPLSVGFESNGEYMDVELNSLTSCEDLVKRLNESGIPEIQVVSAGILPEKSQNAMASVAAASYTVTFKKENPFGLLDISGAITDLLASDEILIEKEGKNGIRYVNIREGIYSLEWMNSENCFKMLLDASSGGNIKPVQVITYMLHKVGLEAYDNMLFVIRDDTFLNHGTEEQPQFLPLNTICINS